MRPSYELLDMAVRCPLLEEKLIEILCSNIHLDGGSGVGSVCTSKLEKSSSLLASVVHWLW